MAFQREVRAAAHGTTISQRVLRNQSAEVMNRLEDGEEFVITRDGRPVGRLTPITGPRTAVPTRELLAAFAHIPPVGAAALRAEMDEFFGDGGDRVG
jgi:prevent-host-death family protein